MPQTMKLNQFVPSWDFEDVGPIPPPPPAAPPPQPPSPPPHLITSRSHSTSISTCPDTSLLDYAVAELTWENGQLAMHGLGLPRVSSKSNLTGAWSEKPSTRASGTLESIVNQAIKKPQPLPILHGGACEKDSVLVPCFDQCVGGGAISGPMDSVSVTMDALVPTANLSYTTRVGSCNVARAARVPVSSEWSVSLSSSTGRERLKRSIEDTCEVVVGDLTNGWTSASFETSPENTNTVTVGDHDSVCHSRAMMERMDEEDNENKASGKSSMPTKRIRAAAIHNQSERKRRDKINQKMKTLQKLVPNSSKTDKASMLDEVIDYLKQLQAQVQMMSMPTSMMMQMAAFQQHLQMSIMSQMDHLNMGVNSMALARPTSHGFGHVSVVNPSNFMSSPLVAAWDCPSTASNGAGAGADWLASHQQRQAMVPGDPSSAAFFGCQSQPMTMDTYSRMAAMYQQLQQLQKPQGP